MSAVIIKFERKQPEPCPPKEAEDAMRRAVKLYDEANRLVAHAEKLCIAAGMKPPAKRVATQPERA